jgi:hypothetical protein
MRQILGLLCSISHFEDIHPHQNHFAALVLKRPIRLAIRRILIHPEVGFLRVEG